MNYFDNKAIVDKTYNGKAFGSNAVALPGDAYVDLDIVHSLGADKVISVNLVSGDETSALTSITDGHNLVVTSVGTATNRPAYRTYLSNHVKGARFIAEADIVVNSGTLVFTHIYDGTQVPVDDVEIVSGKFIYEFTTLDSAGQLQFSFDGTNLFDADILNFTVKEITTNNSYLTYTDPVTQTIETIASQDNASASSKELVVNGDFSDGLNGWILPSDWSIVNGKLHAENVSDKQAVQFNVNSDGKSELFVSCETSNASGSYCRLTLGTAYGTDMNVHTNGIHEGILPEHGNKALYFYPSSFTGDIDNVSAKQVLPISTTYRQTEDFSNAFCTDVAPDNNDRDIIKANPNCIVNMYFTDTNPLGLSFTKINLKHIYLGNEGLRGGSTIYDLVGA